MQVCFAVRAGKPVSPHDIDKAIDDHAEPDSFDRALPGQQLVGAPPIVGRDDSVPPPPLPAGMPRPLRAPKAPTAAERERHSLTHLPYAAWCPYCIAGKRPNSPHRRVKTSSSLPMLSGDYGSFGDDGTGSGN